MSSNEAMFNCPRTGEACARAPLCGVVNAPLAGAVSRIREGVPPGPGKSHAYVRAALTNALRSLGNSMVADFAPTVQGGGARVCPDDILGRIDPAGCGIVVTPEQVAIGLAEMVENTVQEVTSDITLATRRR